MRAGKRVALGFAAIVIATVVSPAQAEEAPFARHVDVAVHVDPDMHIDMTFEESVVVRTASSVQTFGQMTIPVNEHFWDLTITDAYTRKPDGKIIPVSPDKILVSAQPNANQQLMFLADVKLRTIVYPDVAVGDTVHYTAKYHGKVHALGAGDDQAFVVPASARYESYNVTLDAPVGSPARGEADGFSETAESKDGHTVTRWSLKPQTYEQDERFAVLPFDRSPYVVLSSHRDWEEIGHSYFRGADKAGAVTPAIQTLADQITSGVTDKRLQAKAIFEWTQKNIRYMAIFLGQGGFVPHNVENILADRYGDCKDHTTLMRALLSAKGIEADFVLVNLGNTYRRTKIPSTVWQNHVVLYLPAFYMFVDPTDPESRFGDLSPALAGKPGIRIDAKSTSLVEIPTISPDDNHLDLTADVTLRSDGTIVGNNEVTGNGRAAYLLRWAARAARQVGFEAAAKNALQSQNWQGTGKLEIPAADAPGTASVIKASFELQNNFLKDDVNINAVPTGPRYVPFVLSIGEAYLKQKRMQPTPCHPESVTEKIDFHVPADMTITNVPKPVAIDDPNLTYRATYKLDGATLHLERSYRLDKLGPVCTRADFEALKPLLDRAARDLSYRPQFAKREDATAH